MTNYCLLFLQKTSLSRLTCLVMLLSAVSFHVKCYSQTVSPYVRLQRIENELALLAETAVKGLNEKADFSVSHAPLSDFLRGLAETHNLNINIGQGVDIKIS